MPSIKVSRSSRSDRGSAPGSCILVVGPHLSGSSALARVISLCGFHAGPSGELLSAAVDQPRDDRESSWLAGFNDDLLFLFGEDWRTGGLVDLESLPRSALQGFERRAISWAASIDRHGPWVAHDPRLCLTGPFWLRVRPSTRFVLAVRDPEATVAATLERERSPVADPEVALQRWRRHMHGAVMSTRGRPRLVVDYDRLVFDLRGELRRIIDWLPDQGSDAPPFEEIVQLASQEFDRERRHLDHSGTEPAHCETADLDAWKALVRGDEPAVESLVRRWALKPSSFDVQRMLHRRRRDLAVASIDRLEALQAGVAARDERIRAMELTLHNREDQIEAKENHIENLEGINRQLELEITSLKRSWSYRVGRVLVYPGSVAKRSLGLLRRRIERNPAQATTKGAALRERYDRLRKRPLISIVMPVYNTAPGLLRQAAQSVFEQVYENWQLCMADDGSDQQATHDVLQDLERRDPQRVTITRLPRNQGIAAASNAAADLATGEFIAFLDHDDLLTPNALLDVADRLESTPETDLIYSDEDKISMTGRRSEPFHKPDFSPEYLLSSNYVCHFTVMRRSLFEEVGQFRAGFDGSQDYDLILRATEQARRVEHIPKILYHWRKAPGSAAEDAGAKGGLWRESSRKALRSAIERRAWKASALNGSLPGTYRVRFSVDPALPVTIIIPTKDRADLLERGVDSILRYTRHPSFEILVVCNNCENEKTHEYLDRRSKSDPVRSITCNIPFNYARINNIAVEECDTPFLLFLNDDVEITSDGWLSSMLEFAQNPDIGAVGARLLYPDDTVQHAGVVVGMLGVAGHIHRHLPASRPGYFGWTDTIRNVSAVTAACLMTRRDAFKSVGGFTEELEVAFNDIDLCLKLREAGYRIVYTPYAHAYHHEMASRGSDATPEATPRFRREIARMLTRWGHLIGSDPYYNPNLTLMSEDCGIFTAGERRRFAQYLRELRSASGQSRRASGAELVKETSG